MSEHTPEARREWARQTLQTLLGEWSVMPSSYVAGTLRACLGAVDRERVEREQRVLDLADAVGLDPDVPVWDAASDAVQSRTVDGYDASTKRPTAGGSFPAHP